MERTLETAWRPAPGWIAENTATVSHSLQNGYPYQSVASGRIAYNDTCFYKRLTVTDGITAHGSIGKVDFSAIGSFQYINDNMTLDQDFLPLDYSLSHKNATNGLSHSTSLPKAKPAKIQMARRGIRIYQTHRHVCSGHIP